MVSTASHQSNRSDMSKALDSFESSIPAPHPVKKEDLERAIRFLRNLVFVTDKALS